MSGNNLYKLLELLNVKNTSNNIDVFAKVVNSTSSFYREFSIPKRNGGERLISSPYPTLAYIQKLILDKFLNHLEVSPKAFAYVKNKNAIMHAKYHCKSNELLTLDITNFFPSITRQHVFNIFSSIGLTDSHSNYLSLLCTLDNKLPQGACTSPILSNIIFLPVDRRLDKLAASYGLVYSRYADDLAFSGHKVSKSIIGLIKVILGDYGFEVNKNKTKLKLDGYKKILTGVSISNKELKAPKKFKRQLRAEIYELEKFKDNLFGMSNFTPVTYEKILGKLNYLLQVEPENKYALTKLNLLLLHYREFKSTF
ncbi:MAG: reverse transcriptase family protein [Flavobacteriales bacterium]|nr:reverse transcriptase family protein [Flavobacteriales bacterium]